MRKLITSAVAAAALAGNPADAAPAGFAFGPKTEAAQANQPPEGQRWGFSRLFSRANKQPAAAVPLAAVTQAMPALAAASEAKPSIPSAAEKQTPELLVALATAAEAQGKFDVAREHLRRAVGAAPNDVKTLRAAGRFEDRRGELTTAEALYGRAVACAPESGAALNDLAICLARQQRMEESADVFTRAIQLKPGKKLYRNNIAKVLLELDDQEAALGNLVAAHGPAVGRYNLGYLMSARGDNEGAAEQYQLALAADPSLEAARAALASLSPAAPATVVTEALPPAPAEPPAAYAAAPVTSPQPAANRYGLPTPAVASPAFPRILPPITQQR